MLPEYLIDFLDEYRHLGQKTLSNGATLIGKAPHIAAEAWLHHMYAPLSEHDIELIEQQLNQGIPCSYKKFLSAGNGLNIFNTTLSLYGLRSNYNRNELDVWQPFDLIIANTTEKPKGANDLFIIGAYDWDGSKLCIHQDDEQVFVIDNDNEFVCRWKDFDTMLSSELKRLQLLFDSEGKECNPLQSTVKQLKICPPLFTQKADVP